jgi:hypothetical protein
MLKHDEGTLRSKARRCGKVFRQWGWSDSTVSRQQSHDICGQTYVTNDYPTLCRKIGYNPRHPLWQERKKA